MFKNKKKINKTHLIKYIFLLTFVALFMPCARGQVIDNLALNTENGLKVFSVSLSDNTVIDLDGTIPLFSFVAGNKYFTSESVNVDTSNGSYTQMFSGNLRVTTSVPVINDGILRAGLLFENKGRDTIVISNIVPFGEEKSSVFITGDGPDGLARAALFRREFRPVRVILPDNAWELGYSSFSISAGNSLCALARRSAVNGSVKKRYETLLPPGTSTEYTLYVELFTGEWQEGLRLMFRDRYLYDLEKFDNSLYERDDLAWIRESYIVVLTMAWDRDFYDRLNRKYTYAEFLRKGMKYFDSIDVFGIWPTWPRLGLDKRNQWDLYRDLPGGLTHLNNLARISRVSGTRFFIAYNPWDQSTKEENHHKGMASLIRSIEADGVVLDIMGSSSAQLQASADSVRAGVIMYPEGMAVPKDMPGIIAGRVHNAIYYSPELNLNKLIKPDFSIFRVCDVGEDVNHREIAIAFFNGYGTELNMFRPGGRDENHEADMEYLARTTFILRQNNDAFLDQDWTPLLETLRDDIYVNRWNSGLKTIYTILNMDEEGISDNIFKTPYDNNKHYVSLWHHENIVPERESLTSILPVNAEGWPSTFSGTRMEGSVDCIAEFPVILKSVVKGDSLRIKSSENGKIQIWKGNPSYNIDPIEFDAVNDTILSISGLFGFFEGKIVIQLLNNERLADENIIKIKGGSPWLISEVKPTLRAVGVPSGMVLVPGADISFSVTSREEFIPYPPAERHERVDSFLIDIYPVTNSDYYEFIINSGYVPADTNRYLRHWEGGIYRQGQERYPVVYVSYEDMKAYAHWADKRLPTEAEWQLAAQGVDGRKWPWGNEFHATYCNNAFNRPTPVDAFPRGQSPYGLTDLVGNVWQMTNDMYFNGNNYFTVIRGGSFFNPESSNWYIQGGPQALDRTQIMLLVSPGFDRSETVGFRCVKDIDKSNFRIKR